MPRPPEPTIEGLRVFNDAGQSQIMRIADSVTEGSVCTLPPEGGLLGGGGGSLTTASVALGADAPLTAATQATVLTLSLAAGTWLVLAQASVTVAANSHRVVAVLRGASADFASGTWNTTTSSTSTISTPISGIITLGSTTDITLRVTASATATCVRNLPLYAPNANDLATFINAVKIG